MSKRRPRVDKRDQDRDTGTWIQTDFDPILNGYFVSVSLEKDTIRSLTPEECLRHAGAVLGAVARAEHDAAVCRQLQESLGKHAGENEVLMQIARVLEDIRNDRPTLSAEDMAPIWLESGVNTKFEPFLTIHASPGTPPLGQWNVEEARQHAHTALEMSTVADLDSAYLRVITGSIGLSQSIGLNMVSDLQNWRA